MFYERLESLCKQHNISVSVFVRDVLGLNSSSATGWKRGSSPRSSVVLKAAKYFGVSTDYMLGYSDDPTLRLPDIAAMSRDPSPTTAYFEEALTKECRPLYAQTEMRSLFEAQNHDANSNDIDALCSIAQVFFTLPASARPYVATATCDFIKAIIGVSDVISESGKPNAVSEESEEK